MNGPSYILGLEPKIGYITVGTSMLGLCLSLGLVPLLSELIDILEATNKYDPVDISDKTAGLFNSMFNLGNLLAPLIAGILGDHFGYRFTCDFMVICTLIFVFIFYFTMIFRQDLSNKPKNVL
jgi:MFS family permease